MLVTIAVTFVCLRPREMKRLWPALIPALALVHIALPGTLGTLKQSFFPAGGLLAQQSANVGYTGQGRLADLGPALDQFAQHPLLGGLQNHNRRPRGIDGQILDDQWLGTLVETGTVGFVAWLWLLLSGYAVRREALADRSERGWLMTALAASIAAFGVGMLLFDAFAFIQVTVLFFLLSAWAARSAGRSRPSLHVFDSFVDSEPRSERERPNASAIRSGSWLKRLLASKVPRVQPDRNNAARRRSGTRHIAADRTRSRPDPGEHECGGSERRSNRSGSPCSRPCFLSLPMARQRRALARRLGPIMVEGKVDERGGSSILSRPL